MMHSFILHETAGVVVERIDVDWGCKRRWKFAGHANEYMDMGGIHDQLNWHTLTALLLVFVHYVS